MNPFFGGNRQASAYLLRHFAFCIMCLIGFASPTRAGNIFDDDWMPPKPVASPKSIRTSPPAGELGTQAAANTEPEAEPSARKPIPQSAEQARSRGLLKSAFAAQLKDRSAAARKKLAQALLDEAGKAADNASDEYVLLGGAIDSSKDAGAINLSFQAADLMASQYDVDALNIKTDVALKTGFRGDSAAATTANVRSGIGLVDALLEREDYANAGRILAMLRALAASNRELSAAIQERSKAVETGRATHDRLSRLQEKLKISPDDPDANLDLGSYLCFFEGHWAIGLPLLAKGSDANLKRLATSETTESRTAEQTTEAANNWWTIAAKQTEPSRTRIMIHAASLYQSVLNGATGLRRTLMERRIADASAAQEKLALGGDFNQSDPKAGKLMLRFTEEMGYTVAELKIGALTHSNSTPTFRQLPPQFVGKLFTQEFVDRASSVTFIFVTPGKAYILAEEWDGYGGQAAAMQKIAHEQKQMVVKDETHVFHVWSIVGEAGQKVEIPFPGILVADRLQRVDHLQ